MGALKFDPAAAGDPLQPALIGVSGGRDSVALLHALAAAGYRALVVCHFDHGWRDEGAEEAQFVRRLAAQWQLPFLTARCPAPERREAAAREARYQFFARCALQAGRKRLLLAHHADDQVETYLFNLLRGAGGAGLAAMLPVSARTVEGVELEIARPLLGCWRREIDAYVAAEGLDYREDASNADPRHTRSRLRHEILPALDDILGRSVRENVWKTAVIQAAENDYFATLPELQVIGEELEVKRLRALPVALQRRLVLAWLRARAIPGVSFADVEAVRGLVLSSEPAKVNLSQGCFARRRAGFLFLEKPAR